MANQKKSQVPEIPSPQADLGTVLKFGLIAAALAAVANAIVYFVGDALIDIPSDFTPLENASAPIFFSVLGALAATGVYFWLAKSNSHPEAAFQRIALIALLVSFVPNILILFAKPENLGTVEPAPVFLLMVMHVVVAAVCIAVLPRSTAS